ncbi:hypothetical protein JG688_00010678, partial [Phytophthora aleatoria]
MEFVSTVVPLIVENLESRYYQNTPPATTDVTQSTADDVEIPQTPPSSCVSFLTTAPTCRTRTPPTLFASRLKIVTAGKRPSLESPSAVDCRIVFKSNHCNANDGDIYYYTGKEAGDVLHTFKTLLTIRSIYARPMWGNYPWRVAQKCVQPSKRAESTRLGNETSVGIGDEGNGTEWTNTDEETESGSGEEEWKAYGDIFMNGLASAVRRSTTKSMDLSRYVDSSVAK